MKRSPCITTAVSYNPYRWASFVRMPDEQPVVRAQGCAVSDKKIQAWGLELASA